MRKRLYRNSLFVCALLLLNGCGGVTETTTANTARRTTATTAAASPQQQTSPVNSDTGSNVASKASAAAATPETVPTYTYKVKNSWPHDRRAYTQGLIFRDGVLWESTGQYGSSSLRKVELKTGKVIKQISVPSKYFAEGMTVFHNKVFQLTWQEHKGFIYDPETFEKQGEFDYTGEGWGLTHDGQSLIMSDGTNQIRFLDPATLKTTRTVSVFDAGEPVSQLNELEYIDGEIYANIWQSDRIVRLDPKSGKILGWIDMTGLLKTKDRTGQEDVLNGIAYDEAGKRLFVTGKMWPKLFEVEIVPDRTRP
ncbi:MAG TPA: glutaminyl-peptide cyclotransferase [Pyrinomonadaceae bacterium]|nr:glutaminyl-peptide cyclotransferase [Pyrinomonadaceae bacterium]